MSWKKMGDNLSASFYLPFRVFFSYFSPPTSSEGIGIK
jgi:hypothetical protein